jgi:hypothetical protein
MIPCLTRKPGSVRVRRVHPLPDCHEPLVWHISKCHISKWLLHTYRSRAKSGRPPGRGLFLTRSCTPRGAGPAYPAPTAAPSPPPPAASAPRPAAATGTPVRPVLQTRLVCVLRSYGGGTSRYIWALKKRTLPNPRAHNPPPPPSPPPSVRRHSAVSPIQTRAPPCHHRRHRPPRPIDRPGPAPRPPATAAPPLSPCDQ